MQYHIKELIYGSSKISYGNLSFLYGDKSEVLKNRENFCNDLGLDPKQGIAMSVDHKANFFVVDNKFAGKGIFEPNGLEVDALITQDKSIFLFLLTADCLPVILVDPVTETTALVHLGWKGTGLKLLIKTILEMQKLGVNPENILVEIGPGIHKDSYIFPELTQKNDPDWQLYLQTTSDNQIAIDLVGYNIAQLISSGVKKENISSSQIDTAVSKQYYSHYRSTRTGEPEGRFATVVGWSS